MLEQFSALKKLFLWQLCQCDICLFQPWCRMSHNSQLKWNNNYCLQIKNSVEIFFWKRLANPFDCSWFLCRILCLTLKYRVQRTESRLQLVDYSPVKILIQTMSVTVILCFRIRLNNKYNDDKCKIMLFKGPGENEGSSVILFTCKFGYLL